MSLFPADDRKLRELILHVARRCADWDLFQPCVLERILFQSDFLHFRQFGFPITAQAYRRGILSPAPARMPALLAAMSQAGEAALLEEPAPDGIHVRRFLRALRAPELRIFDGQEIAVVESVLAHAHKHWSAARHETVRPFDIAGPDLLPLPWQLAELGEEVPYSLALLSPPSQGWNAVKALPGAGGETAAGENSDALAETAVLDDPDLQRRFRRSLLEAAA